MRLLLATAVLLPLSVFAAEPQVSVQAEVVHTKVSGDKIDPPALKAMQTALGKKVKYGTLLRLSTQKLDLTAAPTTVKLPNQKEATLTLDALKDDVATVRVKLPPSDTTYRLGRTGTFYVQAGPHDDGDLWLVLSPAR